MKKGRHSEEVSFELALGIQIEFQEKEMEKSLVMLKKESELRNKDEELKKREDSDLSLEKSVYCRQKVWDPKYWSRILEFICWNTRSTSWLGRDVYHREDYDAIIVFREDEKA